MFARMYLMVSLSFLPGDGLTLEVNLVAIFLLSEFDCLSV